MTEHQGAAVAGGSATAERAASNALTRRIALRFVLLIGVLSFFVDSTYEGSRSILGPYLGSLGVTATAIGIIMELGECLGYVLRLWTPRNGRCWLERGPLPPMLLAPCAPSATRRRVVRYDCDRVSRSRLSPSELH